VSVVVCCYLMCSTLLICSWTNCFVVIIALQLSTACVSAAGLHVSIADIVLCPLRSVSSMV
jgi:hypothetical protein